MESNILVIDDEESIRFTFNAFLAQEGYNVYLAKNYQEAMALIDRHPFDLIYADIVLGPRTGTDILKEVKQKQSNCPVIMVTGNPTVENAAEAVRFGAFDYLPKPVRQDTLLRVTRHALNHKALIDEKNRIENENRKNRLHLEAIFQSVSDAIVSVDPQMNILQANKEFCRSCAGGDDAIIGTFYDAVIPDCDKGCRRILHETLKTQRPVENIKLECRHLAHPEKVVTLSGAPLIDHENRHIGALLVIRDITRLSNLEKELEAQERFHKLIGKSEKMRQIYRLIENLSGTDSTVLITGESGTGKGLVARALHDSGDRANKPFIKVNCSMLSENLLESELFGHVKGAFTGAVSHKVGRFQLAHGGAIFLDEIGDISANVQLKLLNILQEKEFERVGDSRTICVDVRVIAATNSDLKAKIKDRTFREDLYFRLKVVEIHIPPLRERKEDIPLLCEHFRKFYNDKFGKNIPPFSADVLSSFMDYEWPGNVRELRHAIEHAFVVGSGSLVQPIDLPAEMSEKRKKISKTPGDGLPITRESLQSALEKTRWNRNKAAEMLGVCRHTIYRNIKKFGLRKKY